MDATKPYPGLDDFLMALRFEGIPIGLPELDRLQHAFSLAPALDRQDLKALLACVLIKHAAHRDTFESLFEAWCPPEDSNRSPEFEARATQLPPQEPDQFPPPGPETTPAAGPSEEPDRPQPFWTTWRPWIVALAILLFVSLGYGVFSYFSPKVESGSEPKPVSDEQPEVSPKQPSTTDLPSEPVKQFWTWAPEFTMPRAEPVWPALVIAGLALLGGAFLRWRYNRRFDVPPPDAPPQAGPEWLPLPELESTGPELLHRDELHTAVWGVERFVSDEETHAIDVDHTVAATARAGGLPTIRFEPAVYPREVWLWRDEMVQDATVDRVLDELERSLSLAGLPVRVGTFVDTPELIRWHEGQEFSTLVLEGHRQSALVAILTDGYGMRLAEQSALEKTGLDNVLRAFGEWPRLTFVDVSHGEHGLATLVQAYGLPCIAPQDIPTFLGAGPVMSVTKRRATAALRGDLHAWAAATALSPEPVSADRAFALRERLQLNISSWAYRDLLMASNDSDDRLAWSRSQRAELLNWLTQCSWEKGSVAEHSPLSRALDYWIECYRDASEQRQKKSPNPLLPWSHTPAEQRARMEQALLELWRRPVDATRTLFRLRRVLGQEIRQRLARLSDWDARHEKQPEVVYLPWREAELPTLVRWMLARMGFGGRAEREGGELRMPVRLSVTLGLCAGLAASMLGIVLWRLLVPAPPVFEPALPEPVQAVVIQEAQWSAPGAYRLAIGTPKVLREATAQANSVINLDWQWQPLHNIEIFGQSELWHAGTLPQPMRGCEPGWPRRSLVAIQATPTAKPARQLAIQLLDRGSADAVLVGEDWAAHLENLIQVKADMTTAGQLVLVLPPGEPVPAFDFQGNYGIVESNNLHGLARQLNFSGVRPLQEVWGDANTHGRILLRGGPEKDPDPRTGMTFVKLCGGTFSMGSTEDDKLAVKNEKPRHPVTLGPFEISTTEVTNAQYRRFRKDYKGDDDLPAANITWSDARAFCKHYDYALPTEAEWEYAARAGTTTAYSFGNDSEQLGKYSWYSENSESKTHPVDGLAPNDWGLYDVHGNVREWVEDCYDEDAYQGRRTLAVNPKIGGAIGGCRYRVLRGGSALSVPRLLRSAVRDWFGPGDWLGVVGFRCVRRPRRQP
jgi:formylglycine-generating enzyme required for sulfatase activity